MVKNCGECRFLRTDECKQPDFCVSHKYKLGQPHDGQTHCPKHRVKLKFIKSEIIDNSNVRYVWVGCPACEYKVKTIADWIILTPASV